MSDRLDNLLESYARLETRRAKRLVAVLLLPLCVAVLLEWILLATTTDEVRRFPVPLQEPQMYLPTRTIENEQGWGDLHRLWSPRSDRFFGGMDRGVVIDTDSEGFRSDEHGDDVDIVLYGASFFESGSTNDQMFTGQLARLSGLKVRTRAWPGYPPEFGILHNRLTAEQVSDKKPIVIWALAGRILRGQYRSGGLGSIPAWLDGAGNFNRPANTRVKEAINQLRRWHTVLERYIRARSPLGRLAAPLRRWLPPMSFDPMWEDVHFTRLRPPFQPVPMMIFPPCVEAAYSDAAWRGDAAVVEGVRRVKAYYDRLGVTLVMVLVPDKYQVFREYLDPSLDRPDSTFVPISTFWAEKLSALDMPVIDLYPDIRDAQFADPQTLLYRRDDSHWNDLGILVGAEAALRRLREMGLIPPR